MPLLTGRSRQRLSREARDGMRQASLGSPPTREAKASRGRRWPTPEASAASPGCATRWVGGGEQRRRDACRAHTVPGASRHTARTRQARRGRRGRQARVRVSSCASPRRLRCVRRMHARQGGPHARLLGAARRARCVRGMCRPAQDRPVTRWRGSD